MADPSKMIDALLDACQGNQTELARQLETSQATVYRIWKDGQEPKAGLYNRIVDLYSNLSEKQDTAA